MSFNKLSVAFAPVFPATSVNVTVNVIKVSLKLERLIPAITSVAVAIVPVPVTGDVEPFVSSNEYEYVEPTSAPVN